MKKAVLISSAILVVFFMGTTAVLRMMSDSVTRGLVAQSWSSDELQIHAEGTFNQTLVATPVNGDEVPCVYFVKDVTEDTKLTQRMLSFGFNEIQCGSIKTSIKP